VKYTDLAEPFTKILFSDPTFEDFTMANTKPNLLFVFPDQMRGSALGFLGKEPVITPVLDRFATECLTLPNAVSNYPLCSPYRGMLLTGMYPFANRVISNCTDQTEPYGVELQQGDRCWPDLLKEQGYSTGYIGKWHLESPRPPFINCRNNVEDVVRWNEWTPPERRHGFDFWYAYNTYDYHLHPMYWATGAGREEFHFVDQWGPEHEADLAIRYIENSNGLLRDPSKPFALVVSMNPPHMPYEEVPEKYIQRYEQFSLEDLTRRTNIPPADSWGGNYYRRNIRNYYAMITGVDEQFGRILQALENQGLAQDTIVVFTSDHGNCLGIHECISKDNAYEESLCVPFLVRWPGHIPARSAELLLSAPDIYPTLIDLMGLGAKIPASIEGRSYARLFLGQEMEQASSALYWKILFDQPNLGDRGLRTARYTLICSRKEGREDEFTLFDLQEDPFQMVNIAAQRPDLVMSLIEEMKCTLARLKDPYYSKAASKLD
jgi:arylsulfatase A-like enzyme